MRVPRRAIPGEDTRLLCQFFQADSPSWRASIVCVITDSPTGTPSPTCDRSANRVRTSRPRRAARLGASRRSRLTNTTHEQPSSQTQPIQHPLPTGSPRPTPFQEQQVEPNPPAKRASLDTPPTILYRHCVAAAFSQFTLFLPDITTGLSFENVVDRHPILSSFRNQSSSFHRVGNAPRVERGGEPFHLQRAGRCPRGETSPPFIMPYTVPRATVAVARSTLLRF